MKKHFFFIMAALLLCLCAQAQTAGQGIVFEQQGTKFSQAVQKAMDTKKLIFVDCFTSWCGPCKMMARDVFTQEKVGKFMNAGYVNFQIDMEKGEGPELAKKWQVSAYPTFLILNSAGQELGRFLGGSDADTFLKRVQDNSVDKGSAEMDARWAAGDMPVAMKLRNMWSYYGRDLIIEKDGKVWLDEPKFNQWVAAMQECGIEGRDESRLNVLIRLAERQKDWTAYVSNCEEFFNNPSLDVSDIELCKWMNPLMKDCTDMAVRNRAAQMLQKRYDDLQSGARKAQTRAGNMTLSGNLTAVMPRLIKVLKGEQADFGRP